MPPRPKPGTRPASCSPPIVCPTLDRMSSKSENYGNEGMTPFSPSKKAAAKVKDALPPPASCPYCGSNVEIVNNERIYGRSYGDWPWAYRCVSDSCDSYVGMHPFTNIPLGTLANRETREARKRAKDVFNPLWQSGRMKRGEAYQKLADLLGIEKKACHIGWFDRVMCDRVVEVCLVIEDEEKKR